ncbi:hypothetical protein ACS0TY_002647 [Phlomoides rotata]
MLVVDKLNEMLKNIVANALSSHLTPPVTPVAAPTPDIKVDPPTPGSGPVPAQNIPPQPVAPTGERSNRGDEERVRRSSRATIVDESNSEKEESVVRTSANPEIVALRREMEEVKKRYESMMNPVFKPVGSPFSKEILMDTLSRNFKTLTYENDGTNDPQDHLLRFENGALLHQYTDGVKCRVFLTTLTKAAQQ